MHRKHVAHSGWHIVIINKTLATSITLATWHRDCKRVRTVIRDMWGPQDTPLVFQEG